MTYQEAIERRDAFGVARHAVMFVALWIMGNSWSIAIRQAVLSIVPDNSVLIAEVAAASITTLFALGASLLVTFCVSSEREDAERNPPTIRPPRFPQHR